MSLVQHYRYDALGRLIGVEAPDYPQLDEGYEYDPSDNLLAKTVGGRTSEFTYDLANQLRTREIDGEITRYRYDKAGRLAEETISREVVADYRYGYRDRILELVREDTAVRFHYDSGGLLVGKQKANVPEPTYQMAHAGFGFGGGKEPQADFTEAPIQPWVWEDAFGAGGAPRGAKALLARGDEVFANEHHVSGGVPIVSKDAVDKDIAFHVNDYLGNSLLELEGNEPTGFDGSKKGTAGYAYLTASLGSDFESNDEVEARFTGKPYDEDLQAHVFPFRNYSSDLGRWTSADPAGFPDGLNRHFYAPVPTMGLDPLGLEKLEVEQSFKNVNAHWDVEVSWEWDDAKEKLTSGPTHQNLSGPANMTDLSGQAWVVYTGGTAGVPETRWTFKWSYGAVNSTSSSTKTDKSGQEWKTWTVNYSIWMQLSYEKEVKVGDDWSFEEADSYERVVDEIIEDVGNRYEI